MRKLVQLSRKKLLLLTVAFPIVASIISTLTGFNNVDWNSVNMIIIVTWWLSAAHFLNKIHDEFDLTLSKVAGAIMVLILLIDLFYVDIQGSSVESPRYILGLNIVFPLCGFYITYILTRIYGSVIEKHDPSGLALFPNYLFFLIYPIGIWKFQSEIKQKLENEGDIT